MKLTQKNIWKVCRRRKVKEQMYMVWRGRKIHKFFSNLEKKRALQGQIRKLITDNQEIMDQNKMQNELQLFYRNLFKSNCTKPYDDYKKFLDKIKTPVLTNKKAIICQGDLAEIELFKSLSSMQDCKSPGNDGLTKEFFEYFLNVMKDP